MARDSKTLDDLRREIDAVDDKLHDLIMQRTEIVEGVRELKAGERVKIRPAREAQILFRLMNRHEGPFPRRELVRIWRELIVATLGFEGPFSVAVFAPGEQPGFWDLARDQYGSHTPMTRFDNAARVVETVRDGEVTVGIVPLPSRDDERPWWRHLSNQAQETPRVMARLPFAGRGNARDASGDAVAIAAVKQEKTGRDISCVIVETADTVSLNGFETRLSERGLNARQSVAWDDPTRPGTRLFFTEIFGFLADEQGTLKAIADGFAEGSVAFHAGGYAVPLSQAELDGTERP